MWAVALFARYLIEAKHLVTDPSNIHLFNPVVAAFAAHFLCVSRGIRPGSAWLRRTWRAVATTLFLAGASHAHLSRDLFESFYQGHHVVGMALVGGLEAGRAGHHDGPRADHPAAQWPPGGGCSLPPGLGGWPPRRGGAWDYGHADLALIESEAGRARRNLARRSPTPTATVTARGSRLRLALSRARPRDPRPVRRSARPAGGAHPATKAGLRSELRTSAFAPPP